MSCNTKLMKDTKKTNQSIIIKIALNKAFMIIDDL